MMTSHAGIRPRECIAKRVAPTIPLAGASLCLSGMLAGFLSAGCSLAERSQLARNKALVLRNADAYNAHDRELLAETLADNLVRHCQATPQIEVRSVSDFLAFAESEWAAFPDGELMIDRLVAEGDLVGAFGRFTGTQQGAMGPFPPTNKRVELDFGAVFRIADERIAELWVTWDNLAAMTQLGHWLPPSNAIQISREGLTE